VLSALPEDQLLTPTEAASALAVTARQLARLGAPFIDLGPKNRRYRVADLRGWLESRRRGAA